MSRLIQLATIALLIACAGTACGTVGAFTSKPVHRESDAEFVTQVREDWDIRYASDKTVAALAHATCAALKGGASADRLASTIADSSEDAKTRGEVAHIMGSGIRTFCPEYNSMIENA